MLQLLADNRPLVLENASFNLTLRSPLSGESGGSYVFSLTIPYEPNARAFGFPFRLNRLQVQTASVPGVILFDGARVQEGVWNARSAMAKTIELEMVIGGAHFNSLVDGHTLPEYFDITLEIEDLPAHLNDQVEKAYPEVVHQFPSILNEGFFEDGTNIHYTGVINDFDNSFIEAPNATVIVPQLYLLYIIKQLFAANNYTASGSVFEDEYLKKALLYNNFSLDKLQECRFEGTSFDQVTIKPQFTIVYDYGIVDTLEAYDENTGEYLIRYQGNFLFTIAVNCKPNAQNFDITQVIVETLYNGEVINTTSFPRDGYEVLHRHDVSFEYLFEENTIGETITTRVYFADDALNGYEAFVEFCVLRIVNQDMPTINIFDTSINYRNHVPKLDVKTFILAFCNAFKILPFFNHVTKKVELVFLRDLFAAGSSAALPVGLVRDTLKVYPNDYNGLSFSFDFNGPDDLLSGKITQDSVISGTVERFYNLPSVWDNIGKTYYVTSLNAYYRVEMIDPKSEDEVSYPDWRPVGDKHFPLVIDNGALELSTSMAPLLMRNYRNTRYWSNRSMPSINALGYSNNYDIKGDFPLRVFFYVGLVDTQPLDVIGTTTQYPFASTTKYDTFGNQVLPISFIWEDLIDRYWLPVIAWFKRRMKLEFTNLVSPGFINMLNLQDRFFLMNTRVFISDIVIKVKNKFFGPGDFEGWTG